MVIPKGWDYNFDENISGDEYEVIHKFLASYQNQSVIIADSFRQDFSMVPLEKEEIVFKTNENTWKSMNFCRRIYYKKKPYIVELQIWGEEHYEYRIITNKKVHFINLDFKNISQSDSLILERIHAIWVFERGKIISPEQAYCKQMYTNRPLQQFMANHEWKKIEEGIKQAPSLANALFIIREGYENISNYTADFGTILYQLISFRQKNQNNFDEKDLYELDKLILKLRKTELLKVQLYEQTAGSKSRSTNSILLESNNSNDRMHCSKQYNVTNNELTNEKKILNKCIRTLKK